MRIQYKPWMLNDRMWESGVKANKWPTLNSKFPISWFCLRDPNWSDDQIDYHDYCYSLIMQSRTGWN